MYVTCSVEIPTSLNSLQEICFTVSFWGRGKNKSYRYSLKMLWCLFVVPVKVGLCDTKPMKVGFVLVARMHTYIIFHIKFIVCCRSTFLILILANFPITCIRTHHCPIWCAVTLYSCLPTGHIINDYQGNTSSVNIIHCRATLPYPKSGSYISKHTLELSSKWAQSWKWSFKYWL